MRKYTNRYPPLEHVDRDGVYWSREVDDEFVIWTLCRVSWGDGGSVQREVLAYSHRFEKHPRRTRMRLAKTLRKMWREIKDRPA